MRTDRSACFVAGRRSLSHARSSSTAASRHETVAAAVRPAGGVDAVAVARCGRQPGAPAGGVAGRRVYLSWLGTRRFGIALAWPTDGRFLNQLS